MKNFIIGFLSSVVLMVITATTAISTTIFKPSTPKSTVILVVHQSDVFKKSKPYLQKGYKTYSVSSANDYGTVTIVLEKY